MIYRLFRDELSSEIEFFKIKPGSHLMSSPMKILDIPDEDIHLKPNEVLVLDGEIVIKWPKPGGGLCMLQAIKKKRQD